MIAAAALWANTIGETVARSFAYRATMTAMQWAETERRMDGGRRYRFDFAPYQQEMMATPFDKGANDRLPTRQPTRQD